MNIKLYRQKKKIPAFGGGKKIYQGEDSRPYADSEVLIVADGLGGRGGFPHTKIDHRILNREEIYGVLFSSVFTADVSPEFKEFVIDNFTELFETEAYYWESDDTQRRSGYFASRIVTAIALYEIKYNPDFARSAVFDGFDGKTEEEKDELALSLGKRLGELVLEKLTLIAELGGFEMEVNNRGAYLLPSTLTVALMNEREDAVDVLYLWAGDSRGYFWNVEDGMAQVTEDHEQDETMTNLITLSRPFTVEGRFLTVKKPCAIFNASDGVYKPPSFACSIDQEYVFLLAVDMYDNEADAMSFLEKQYNMLSPDDSSTLALYGAGYESFADFKNAVKERMAVIERDYKSKLPGIFDCDYAGDLAKLMNDVPNHFAEEGIAKKILAVPEIAKIVTNDMVERKYPPYVESLNAKMVGASEGIERQRNARAALVKYVEGNWISGGQFKGMVRGAIHSYIDGESVYELDGALRRELKAAAGAHCSACTQKNKDIVSEINGFITKTMKPTDVAFTAAAAEAISQMEAAFAEFIEYCRSVQSGEEENARAFLESKQESWRLNQSYVEHDREAIDGFVELLISVDSIEALPEYYRSELAKHTRRMAVGKYVAEYAEASRELSECTDEVVDEKEKFALMYWCGNKRLHGLIWNQYNSLIPEELVDEILAEAPGAVEKRRELSSAIEKREELYSAYNKLYFRQYRPTRI